MKICLGVLGDSLAQSVMNTSARQTRKGLPNDTKNKKLGDQDTFLSGLSSLNVATFYAAFASMSIMRSKKSFSTKDTSYKLSSITNDIIIMGNIEVGDIKH